MLDAYERGRVTRLNPEAPASLVLDSDSIDYHLGGAANVAHNLRTLGASVTLFGFIGEDYDGQTLKELVTRLRISPNFFHDGRRTTTKLRVVEATRNHQVLRIDRENKTPMDRSLVDLIMDTFIREMKKGVSAVVLSDYVEGFLIPDLAKRVIDVCSSYRVPVLVDTKPERVEYYKGATVLKPNLAEAEKMTGISLDRQQPLLANPALLTLSKKLQQDASIQYVFITCGKEGISSITPAGEFLTAPALEKQIYDVTGAGDTVMAVLTLGFASGFNLQDVRRDPIPILSIMESANLAAGIVIQKPGTSTVSLEELLAAHKTTKTL